MLQYNAALIKIGTIKGTCRDKVYQELCLEPLADRKSSRKLIFFHKIILGLQPSYLQKLKSLRTYLTRSSTKKSIKTSNARTKAFESSFFPYFAKEWGNLFEKLRNIDSVNLFKSSTLNFFRTRENSN